ncbi:MAG TPA: cation:proton antiporter [Burkholderiales bacterium]
MTSLDFLPSFPLVPGDLALIGAILAIGLLSGELFRRLLRLPRISGYLLVGIALGPGALDLLDRDLLAAARVVLDVALGLILYELGSRLDLGWVRRNRWLLVTSVAESALSFALVYLALRWLAVSPLHAAVAAAIAMSSSPSVLLLVIHDERAEGALTEQALNLTALNNIFAVVTVTMLLAYMHLEYQAGVHIMLLHPVYLLLGSLAVGYAAAALTVLFAGWLGKREDLQFVMLVSMVLLAVGSALALRVSVLLTLLAFGVLARNRDRRRVLLPVEFGPAAQFFFVALFVLTGAYLEWKDLRLVGGAALVYVMARVAGKLLGILVFAPLTGLRLRKAALLGVVLAPMAAVAVVLVQTTTEIYPAFGAELGGIVLSAVVVLALAGPIAAQVAFRLAGETRQEAVR